MRFDLEPIVSVLHDSVMDVSNDESLFAPVRGQPLASPRDSPDPAERVAQLSDRQRSYLRLVYQHRNSKEIAAIEGTSHRAVDKQLMKANALLGTATRFEAARLLVEQEMGVGSSTPAIVLPSSAPLFPLPMPLPTAEAAVNTLTWKQVALWSTIIAIVTPIGLTVAGMVIVTLALLLGFHRP